MEVIAKSQDYNIIFYVISYPHEDRTLVDMIIIQEIEPLI